MDLPKTWGVAVAMFKCVLVERWRYLLHVVNP